MILKIGHQCVMQCIHLTMHMEHVVDVECELYMSSFAQLRIVFETSALCC